MALAWLDGILALGVTIPAYAYVVLCVTMLVSVSDDRVDDVLLLRHDLWATHIFFDHSGVVRVSICHV